MAWQEGCCVKLPSLWLQHSGERVRARLIPLSLSPPTEKRIEHSQTQDSHSLGTLSCITQGHTKRTADGKLVSGAHPVLPTQLLWPAVNDFRDTLPGQVKFHLVHF